MTTNWKTAEAETVITLFRDSLKDSIADHRMILELLMQRQDELSQDVVGDLGDLLEDASNIYMAMSESVSRKFPTSRYKR